MYMCIIVAKRRGFDLPMGDTLDVCFDSNPHGAGFMYVLDGSVKIEKGFMNVDSFIKRLTQLDSEIGLKDRNVVMHFRISTSGLVDQGNCHPYPVTTNDSLLRELSVETNLGMVHNGVISKHIPPTDSVFNDTQMFIKNYVSAMHLKDSEFLNKEENLTLLELEAGSKLCFLDTNDNMFTVGNFIEEDGILYSNDSYIPWDYAMAWEYWENTSSYCDILDIEGEKLPDESFFHMLDNNYVLGTGVAIDSDGNTHDCGGTLCVDPYNNMFRIDYKNNSFTYLGEFNDVM